MAAYSRSEILGRAFLLCKVVIFVGMSRAFGYDYIPGASESVRHPATTLKPADLKRAKQNIAQHEWARQYAEAARSRAPSSAAKITPEWLLGMVPGTTPGDTLFTPCPACPDQLTCKKCGTVFLNEKYPESVVLKTKWGG